MQEETTEIKKPVQRTTPVQAVSPEPNPEPDRYDINVLAQYSENNYGVPQHDVYGAVSWAKLTNHEYANNEKFSHDEMKSVLDGYLNQEDLAHKAALELRGS